MVLKNLRFLKSKLEITTLAFRKFASSLLLPSFYKVFTFSFYFHQAVTAIFIDRQSRKILESISIWKIESIV